MRFLITNDDGFDAPGLQALWEALVPLGAVEVVAPAVCHSSKGHAVDTKNSIRVEQRDVEPFGRIRVVQASPADCIRVGLRHVMLENPPDVVVAGINPGTTWVSTCFIRERPLRRGRRLCWECRRSLFRV